MDTIKSIVIKLGNGAPQRLVKNYNAKFNDTIASLDSVLYNLLTHGYSYESIANMAT